PETALKAKPEIKPEAPVEKSISPVAIPIRKIKEILNSKKAEKTATSPSETITEAEVRDREYRAEKRGLSRGVVSGGVAGWLLGRRGRSKMEREIKNSVNRRKQAEKDLG